MHLLAQQQQSKPRLRYTALPHGMHRFEACSGHQVLAQHTSVSYKYARKKAIYEALKSMVRQSNAALLNEPGYQDLVHNLAHKQQQEADTARLAKLAAWQQKQAIRIKEKADAREKNRQKAWEEDRKRRLAKQDHKEKKKKKETIYRTYTAEEIAAMSVSKRRNLEDRGIIPRRGE
jgi:hypothetical protein